MLVAFAWDTSRFEFRSLYGTVERTDYFYRDTNRFLIKLVDLENVKGNLKSGRLQTYEIFRKIFWKFRSPSRLICSNIQKRI